MSKLHSLVPSREEKRRIVEEIVGVCFDARPEGFYISTNELDRIIDKLDPPEPAIMSYDEWVRHPANANVHIGDGLGLRTYQEDERRMILLLYARYVARECGASTKPHAWQLFFAPDHPARANPADPMIFSGYPFRFDSVAGAKKFHSIVGEENLAEIRKLFY